jgi:hypothetical protein
MKPMTAIIIGAGDRGLRAYAPFALEYPNEFKMAANRIVFLPQWHR